MRMLGVVENRILGPADHLLKQAADLAGVGDTFYRTHVAVFQAPEGEAGGQIYPDPYFGGLGPERATCIGCGGCMVGCRYNAKNTPRQELPLPGREARRARIRGNPRGGRRGRSTGKRTGAKDTKCEPSAPPVWLKKNRRRFTCRGVVFAASALGTLDLLFRLKQRGSLPALSGQLGNRVRTNAESLIGVRVPGIREDLSKGIAIGSGIYLDEHTHIEATRYPKGSDAMALMGTLLTGGRPGWTRILLWLRNLAVSLARHPWKTLRCLHPFGWARESLILLCMQSLEGHIDMRLARPWYWPFGKVLVSRGKKIPTFIPRANEFARQVARMAGGTPMSMLTEILFDIPGTAHILGGCPMSGSAEGGVVDHHNRVFSYKNMYICDGSVLSANLGVNPSLTICAITERAMSLLPKASETDWNDFAPAAETPAAPRTFYI